MSSAEAAAPEVEVSSAEAAAPEVEVSSAEAAALATELGSTGYDSQGRPGRIHIVRPRDTLWDISDAYLGTPWVWPSIWQDNREIENPHLIHPGDRIWITETEMRRVSAEEAQALLAGAPAALDEETGVELEPEVVAPAPQIVPEERPTYFVSDREMVGLIGADTVEASASIVSAAVPRVMLSQGDRVWVGLGEDEVEAGDQFTIFRVQEKVYDPETGRMLGYHVHILGWVEILEPHGETSLAEIKESVIDIVKGDQLMARKPRVREIAIQSSPEAVEGQISFLAEKRTLVGTHGLRLPEPRHPRWPRGGEPVGGLSQGLHGPGRGARCSGSGTGPGGGRPPGREGAARGLRRPDPAYRRGAGPRRPLPGHAAIARSS